MDWLLIEEIEKTFPLLEQIMAPDDWDSFLHSEYTTLCQYHFGLGTWIRNHLLVEGRPLLTLFQQGGIQQKDDMSMLVIPLFYLWARGL